MILHRKLRRAIAVFGFGVLLLLLATFPVTYLYLSSRLSSKYSPRNSAVDLSFAPDIPTPVSVLLDYAGAALQSVQTGNLTQTKIILAYLDNLPPNTDNNLKTYLTLVSSLASDMKSLNQGMNQLQGFVQSGQVDLARQNVTQVKALLTKASGRLSLLSSALDRIQTIYGVDVSEQRAHLGALKQLLLGVMQRLHALEIELQALDKRVATEIVVIASPIILSINEALNVTGQLTQVNVTGLPGRIISVWVNQSEVANLTTNSIGGFNWEYSIQPTNRPHMLLVYASFQPMGQDVDTLRPALSPIADVQVEYYPVVLTATTSTKRVHVLESFAVTGRLADAGSNPLSNETVWLLVDNKPVNNSKTNAYGDYALTSYLPANTTEGYHELVVQYNPTRGIFSSDQSQKMNVVLYYLNPTIKLSRRGNSSLGFSGQTLDLTGNLTIDSTPLSQGLILILEGNRELGRTTSESDGSFRVVIMIPFEAAGLTTLTIMFTPTTPWVLGRSMTLTLNILNSVILGSGFFTLAAAMVTLSRQSVERRSELLRRRMVGERVTLERLTPGGERTHATATMHLVRLRRIRDPSLCVKETYWEVRRLFSVTLHESGQVSETPREFASRLNSRFGDSAHILLRLSLSPFFSILTFQFEFAEYSPRPISQTEAEKNINFAVLVAEALSAKVDFGEWQNFVEKSRTAAAEVLRGFGMLTSGIVIDPQKAIVEISWHIPVETRIQLNHALEVALGMPAGSVPVRYCDRCAYKMKGAEVEKPICPRCARTFKEGAS